VTFILVKRIAKSILLSQALFSFGLSFAFESIPGPRDLKIEWNIRLRTKATVTVVGRNDFITTKYFSFHPNFVVPI